MKLIKDPSKLKSVITPSTFTKEEIDKVSKVLSTELEKHGGLGLSANQIGLTDRVCIVNVKEPLILVNPRVTETSKETVVYVEQCLSLDKTM